MIRCSGALALAAVGCLLSVLPARAYVDLAPTLAQVVRQAQTITVAEVERFHADKGAVLLKKVCDLKGETSADPCKHQVVRAGELGIDRSILEWAEPGRRCVLFSAGKTVLVCLGEAWYQTHSSNDGWWRLGAARPDLPLAYYGTVSRLVEALPLMLAGKSAIITTLPHGADQEGASFDLALNRASLPGLVRVQRLRANLRMPGVALGIGASPAFLVGMGRAGKDDIAVLRKRLGAADAATRADAAIDLGSLGQDAASAAPELSKLLDDPAAMVRLAAAAALLRVQARDKRSVQLLEKSLASEDAATRRQAARSVGLAGAAAAPLAGKLAVLLHDPDMLVRRTALQAIATLGPAAAEAVEPVMALLEQPESAIDAADALGRIGLAARPALKSLARMLSAEAASQRWAAVRAMAQIGGNQATPAVTFMIRALPSASEVESYNMMIYLSLLGPVAREAIPAIQSSHLKNPFLRQTTIWAIEPGTNLPWLGPLGDSPFVQWALESYVHELGDHLKPVAQALVEKIMAGTAGNVPGWGYKLLARYPEQSLAVLIPALADKELVLRERAAVALGYMGRAAAAAAPHVAQARDRSPNEREQRLLAWCLREIE